MVERQRMRSLYADAHADLYRKGCVNQISFYGTLKNPYDGKHVQARIEVMSPESFNKEIIAELYELFTHFSPEQEYYLFVYADCLFNTSEYGLQEVIVS